MLDEQSFNEEIVNKLCEREKYFLRNVRIFATFLFTSYFFFFFWEYSEFEKSGNWCGEVFFFCNFIDVDGNTVT